jgi:hypothetical protein
MNEAAVATHRMKATAVMRRIHGSVLVKKNLTTTWTVDAKWLFLVKESALFF